jgi:cell division septation protein DedD
MAKLSFPERNPEDQEIQEEEVVEDLPLNPEGGGLGRSRRILIIAGIGAVLIGGLYLANQLFLAPSPPSTSPARPAIPAVQSPAATATAPSIPSPAGPAQQQVKGEDKSATPAPPTTTAPTVSTKQAAPGKSAGAATGSGKVEPGRGTISAKVEAKPAAKSAPAPSSKYSLQMGAMVMEENAEALKRRLDASGFPADIRKGTAYVAKQVVTVGDPSSKREAEELSRQLNVDGFPSQLLEVDGKYTPQIGAFFNLDEAIDLARELQKKNYRPKISSRSANTVVYQVRHGRFDSRSDAVKRGEELKSKGFTQAFVVSE